MHSQAKDKLILIIRSAFSESQITKDFVLSSEEITEICSLAQKHNVGNIVYHILSSKNLVDESDERIMCLKQDYLKSIRKCARQSLCLAEIESAFEEEKIDYIPLKGMEIRSHYPEEWMRTSNDIDLLVKQKCYDKACNAISNKLKYSFEDSCGYHKGYISNNNVEIEVHNKLNDEGYSSFSVEQLTEETWKTAEIESGRHRYKLRDDYYYLYHVAHMMRHFINGGCGVKFFLDLWILNKKDLYPITDDIISARETLLKRYGLQQFERQALKLSKQWFDGECFSGIELFERFIIEGGTFGTREQKARLGSGIKGSKTKYLASRALVSRDFLKLSYPILGKYPVLTPIYEVVRWFRLVFKDKTLNGNEFQATIGSDKESIEEMKKIKMQAGL